MFPNAIVKRTPDGDYLYRTTLEPETVANAVMESILDIDYDNFKNAVTDKRRKVPYTRVWFEMSQMQEQFEHPYMNKPKKRGNPRSKRTNNNVRL